MEEKNLLTKEDLAEQLAKEGRMQKGEALRTIELVFSLIARGLLDKDVDAVKIAGFGQFSVSDRAERVGVNPSNTGEKITIPASKGIKFKASKTLKDLVNE